MAGKHKHQYNAGMKEQKQITGCPLDENAEWKLDYLLRGQAARWRRQTPSWLRCSMIKVTPTNHSGRRTHRRTEVAGRKWRHLELLTIHWNQMVLPVTNRPDKVVEIIFFALGKLPRLTACLHTVSKSLLKLFNPSEQSDETTKTASAQSLNQHTAQH